MASLGEKLDVLGAGEVEVRGVGAAAVLGNHRQLSCTSLPSIPAPPLYRGQFRARQPILSGHPSWVGRQFSPGLHPRQHRRPDAQPLRRLLPGPAQRFPQPPQVLGVGR